jgi:hypothetical protein
MHSALKFVCTAVAIASLAACSRTVTQREIVRESATPTAAPVAPVAPERIVIVQPPAPLQEQMSPPPATTGYSWVPGHYTWHDDRWNWEPGQWRAGAVSPMPPARQELIPQPPYSGARWVPGYWNYNDNGWTWVQGRWL